ncbi:3-deoxy-7-phosphoheptulonate synthase [Streptomyces pseudovenezuelae]|uniref:3-deoxy-7-phosphoheptulonate synthase n=1 Tax=Streptomyces pseudovenezuelae TaxID=67350 RepID=UPI002E3117DB|nr:3-deoxy-7-phosphoheptulonate synthase [Streptomyces pseudovenezuelae]
MTGSWPRDRAPWHPASWRRRPAGQPPGWPQDDRLREARDQLAARPGLVTAQEVATLRRRLADVAWGRGLVIQMGDCAETFAPATPTGIGRTLELFRDVTRTVEERLALPALAVGRIAGQFAKPRSSPTEEIDGLPLPAFRGFLVNDMPPDAIARRPEPRRMLWGYEHAARTLFLLRRAADEGLPLRGHWGDGLPALWTSHEALVLDYEEPLTRWDADADAWVLTSTHLPWTGERTRHPDGAHVRFLAGLSNPVGCKVGPAMTPGEIVRLAGTLDPGRDPGRLVLISRMGADRIEERLPQLVEAVRAAGHAPVWLCDPMHGNTVRAAGGHKTRRMGAVVAETEAFVRAVCRAGGRPGGLHLESTAEDVTECVGGRCGISEKDLPRAYLTACDPRLNADQTKETVERFVDQLKRI